MLFFPAALLLAHSFGLIQAIDAASTTTTSSRASVCTAGTVFVPSANRNCTVLCGQDRPGGNYAAQGYAIITGNGGCLEACAKDPTCVTAQYNEDNSFCYFKNQANPLVASSNTDTVDCSTPVCTPAVTAWSSRSCTQTCNQDRPGGDYKQFQSSGVNACTAACLADQRCLSAQYNRNSGFCYLKDQVTPSVDSTSVDSALCVTKTTCTADLSSDIDNCGSCGNKCANDQFCSNYVCVPRWNLCQKGEAWQSCGSSRSSCICWATAEGAGVCLPYSIADDNGCETSRDCRGGASCWGPWGGPGSWGLCVNPSSYTPECRNGANPKRVFARGFSPKREAGPQFTAHANLPVITVTSESGESWNVTVLS